MRSSRVLRLGVGFKPRTPPPSRPPRSPSSLNRLSEAKRAKPGKPGVLRCYVLGSARDWLRTRGMRAGGGESKHSTMTTYSWSPICSPSYFRLDHVVEHERFQNFLPIF